MPKTKPQIKVYLDIDNCLLHTDTVSLSAVKDTYTIIEETENGNVRVSMLRPCAISFLEKLKAKGYVLCAFSSGILERQTLVLEKLGISEYFEQVHCGDSKIATNADAFVLVDDMSPELGTTRKLAALGVPDVVELTNSMEQADGNWAKEEATKRLTNAIYPYFLKCAGWSGIHAAKEIDIQPLTTLVPEIVGRIERQLRSSYYYVSLIPGRIPHVANQDERYDVPGDKKIAETTKQLEAFHPSFTVVSTGVFSALTVKGSVLMLKHLFPNGALSEKYAHRFPYIREATWI